MYEFPPKELHLSVYLKIDSTPCGTESVFQSEYLKRVKYFILILKLA